MEVRRTYLILALSTAFLGATVGVERSVLSLLGQEKFGLSSKSAVLSFLVSFGLAKALSNLASGPLTASLGPARLLKMGWAVALPVPALLVFAPNWGIVIAANALLGANQGICWSVAVVGMMEATGPAQRGRAAGANEFAGYIGVALAAAGAGWLADRAGIRLAPFVLMQAVAASGFVLCLLSGSMPKSRSGGDSAGQDSGEKVAKARNGSKTQELAALLGKVSWQDRRLASACLAGLVTNLTDAVAWALLPLYFSQRGMPLHQIAVLSGVYPAVWAVGQLGSGRISDRVGRGPVIAAGLLVQAGGVAALLPAGSFRGTLAAMAALGAGTALSYPTLLAAVADNSSEAERPAAVGIYRLWRDLGYVVGALVAGAVADAAGAPAAIAVVAALTALAILPVAVNLLSPPSLAADVPDGRSNDLQGPKRTKR